MTSSHIKQTFGSRNALKIYLYYLNHDEIDFEELTLPPPICCRQVASKFIINPRTGHLVDESPLVRDINAKYLHEAYIRECNNEFNKKILNYETNKIKYKFQEFKKIITTNNLHLPEELFLKIETYLY